MPRIVKKNNIRKVRNRLLIVCGGSTEKYYFDRIKAYSLYEVTSIKIRKVDDGETKPLEIVNEAIRLKNNFDLIYAVFDKDNFDDFDLAIMIAQKNGVIPIYSNQAFELWIYYHFEYFCGNKHRDKLIELIKMHISSQKSVIKKEYSKSDLNNIWDIIEPNIRKAMENSKRSVQFFNKLNNEVKGYERISNRESSTNVYELMDKIYRN